MAEEPSYERSDLVTTQIKSMKVELHSSSRGSRAMFHVHTSSYTMNFEAGAAENNISSFWNIAGPNRPIRKSDFHSTDYFCNIDMHQFIWNSHAAGV